MHLALAEEILSRAELPPTVRRLLAQQRGSFLLGNTAPDVQTVSGQARHETHFYAIPRTSSEPAHDALFDSHPSLAQAKQLPEAQAAFIAGYIAHLRLDELWLDHIFLPFFLEGWASPHERMLLHNVLRTWMDRQDQRRLNGSIVPALRATQPHDWLPFVDDEHLVAWRDLLIEQFAPGHRVQTAEFFARRMDVPVTLLETVLSSPQQMEKRVFRHVPRAALQTFHSTGYAQTVALLAEFLGRF